MARKTTHKPRAIGTGPRSAGGLDCHLSALDSRTLPHGVVFNGLDQIDQALGDVAATSAALDEIIANMSDGGAKHEAIDNLFRHLQADLGSLQRAERRGPRDHPAACRSGVAISTVPRRAVQIDSAL